MTILRKVPQCSYPDCALNSGHKGPHDNGNVGKYAIKPLSGGDCFEAAAQYILERKEEGLTLVHGRPTLQCEPFMKYEHAWIEMILDGDHYVRDVSNGKDVFVPRAVYYGLGQIVMEDCYRYTFNEMRTKLLEFKHWGPWDGPFGSPPMEESDNG